MKAILLSAILVTAALVALAPPAAAEPCEVPGCQVGGAVVCTLGEAKTILANYKEALAVVGDCMTGTTGGPL